ncbi:MAG TPA: hypothetical protein VMX97_15015 [Hyphomicrobiaceae bacterium]|nr:hypothetical protein [Hyphomicrobiaceae bacterium]
MEPRIITAPTTEAVSEAELKAQIGIATSDTSWDTHLALIQTAARSFYERRVGRTMHETELEIYRDHFPGTDRIELPRATPLISITAVAYKDSDGVETSWAASNYIADTTSPVGAVVAAYGVSWPSFTPYPVNPIRVRYKAGTETASPIDEVNTMDKLAILQIGSAFFENRDGWKYEAGVVELTDAGLLALIDMRLSEWVF